MMVTIHDNQGQFIGAAETYFHAVGDLSGMALGVSVYVEDRERFDRALFSQGPGYLRLTEAGGNPPRVIAGRFLAVSDLFLSAPGKFWYAAKLDFSPGK